MKTAAAFSFMLVLLAGCPLARAAETSRDFTTYSLEELMNMELTTASKKPQKASLSSSAVFVITQEDIRRSGAVNLPEVLRMAPGIQVLRADPGTFAISSRGFMGKYNNKLLVMVDGRSIYSPSYSGVFWIYNDIPLENIERIEVIRGPGATLWGANAVNGVINIITKHSRDMQGGLAVATTSNQEGYDEVRYGARLKENMYLTAYGKYMHFGDVINPQVDDRRQRSGGGRFDWKISESDSLFASMQYFDSFDGGTSYIPLNVPPPETVKIEGHSKTSGGNMMARWDHTFSPTSDMSLQIYHNFNFNRGERDTYYRPAQDSPDLGDDVSREQTSDIDFRHTFALDDRNSIVWGMGLRYSKAHKQDNEIFYTLNPHETERQRIYNFFLQDEMVLVPERLHLIIGSKFEYNSYTQLEVQPSVRLLYTPTETQTLWGAVSRAVRTPSFIESHGTIPSAALKRGTLFPLSPPALIELQGDNEYGSEELIAYELGYRNQLYENFNIDTALFYNVYDDLRSLEIAQPDMRDGSLLIPVLADNKMHGRTYGGELSATWQVLPQWRLQATYSHLRMNLIPDSGSTDTLSESGQGMSSRNLCTLRSLYSITPSLECDLSLYFSDRIEGLNNPSHTDLNLRVGWKPVKCLMIEGIGSNLIDNKYRGYRDDVYARGINLVRRVFYGRFTVFF